MKTYKWSVEGCLRKSLNAAPVPIQLWGEIESHKQETGKILQAIAQRIVKEFPRTPYLDSIGITICPKEDDGKVVAP